MERKIKFLMRTLFFLVFFIFIFFYHNYHNKLIHIKESYYYYNIVNSLDNLDIKTAKFYSKKIFSYNTGDIYYDISCFLLYNLEHDRKKMIYYKTAMLENKKSIFKKLLD